MIHSLELVVTMADRNGSEFEVGRAMWNEERTLNALEFFASVEGLYAAIDLPWFANRTFVRVELHDRWETIEAKNTGNGPMEIAHALWTAIAEAGGKV